MIGLVLSACAEWYLIQGTLVHNPKVVRNAVVTSGPRKSFRNIGTLRQVLFSLSLSPNCEMRLSPRQSNSHRQLVHHWSSSYWILFVGGGKPIKCISNWLFTKDHVIPFQSMTRPVATYFDFFCKSHVQIGPTRLFFPGLLFLTFRSV